MFWFCIVAAKLEIIANDVLKELARCHNRIQKGRTAENTKVSQRTQRINID